MRSLCLTIARFTLAGWLGAAMLFVLTNVIHEQRSPELASPIKDKLAVLHFSDYYAFGFAMVIVSLLFGWAARKHTAVSPLRIRAFLGLLVLALLLMLADYIFIYRPLAEMITPPGSAKPANFNAYHNASMWINSVDIGICLVAALFVCWPNRLQRN